MLCSNICLYSKQQLEVDAGNCDHGGHEPGERDPGERGPGERDSGDHEPGEHVRPQWGFDQQLKKLLAVAGSKQIVRI